MALHNRERGVVTLEADGTPYRLVLDLNAMVALEGHFSTPTHHVTILEIAMHLQRGSATHTLAVVWAALQAHHPELTMADAGRIIWAAGGLPALKGHIDGLMASMQADAADLAALEVEADASRPPAAPSDASRKRTIGGASSSPRAVSG